MGAAVAVRFDRQVNTCILFSPGAMKDTDLVFRALADRSRRALLDRLHERDGQALTELCADLDMSRQAVTQHLDILEAAHLVVTTWRGREKLHFLNPVPLQEIYDRWIGKFERSRVRAMRELKRRLEETKSA
jgi:DNA-binding transcriptional ArsR family regulator